MKHVRNILASLTVSAFMLPAMTFAQDRVLPENGGEFGDLLSNIIGFINSVIIPFIIGIGFLVFVWGMFQYFIAGGANDEKKESGKSLMVYATLGFVLIIIFWGIVNLLAQSTGLGGDTIDNIPGAAPVITT